MFANLKYQIPNTKYLSLRTEKGFTLIELSIVIVIIVLIVAGVVGGQALVNQAKLRSIVSDVNQVKVAMNTFKLEYNALPGDMRNIQSYYPSIGNGNGDKLVTLNSPESVGFWTVLELEGLYKKYSEGTNVESLRGNTITPYGKGALYRIISGNLFGGVYGESQRQWYMQIGDVDQNNRLDEHVLTSETISIDLKYDDGLADKGWIKAGNNYDLPIGSGCVVENVQFNAAAATYDFSDDTDGCLIFFDIP